MRTLLFYTPDQFCLLYTGTLSYTHTLGQHYLCCFIQCITIQWETQFERKKSKHLLELSFQCCDSGLQGVFELHLFLHVSLSLSPHSIYPFQLCLPFVHLPLQSFHSQSKLQHAIWFNCRLTVDVFDTCSNIDICVYLVSLLSMRKSLLIQRHAEFF